MSPSPPLDLDEAVTQINRDTLLATDQEVLAQWCLAQFGWPPASSPFVQLGTLHDHLKTATRFTVHIPLMNGADYFQEGRELLDQFGSCGYTSCGSNRVVELEFAIDQMASTLGNVANLREQILNVLSTVNRVADAQASRAEERATAKREAAEARARQLIAQRVTIEEALRLAKSDLGIPLNAESDTVSLPFTPAGLDLDKAMQRASAGVPERSLDSEIRKQILTTIANFARALERLPGTTQRLLSLDEEALRDVLLFIINANWRVATGEAFSGSGKTDIQLQFDGRVAFTAELKKYDGPKVVSGAIDQLCSYLTWRDTHAALVIFIIDRKDISAAMRSVREAICSHPSCVGDPQTLDHGDRYRMTTEDAARTLTMDLIMVALRGS